MSGVKVSLKNLKRVMSHGGRNDLGKNVIPGVLFFVGQGDDSENVPADNVLTRTEYNRMSNKQRKVLVTDKFKNMLMFW